MNVQNTGKLSIITLLFALFVPFLTMAQKPGYKSYVTTAYINDGVRSGGSSQVTWVKFDGNLILMDHGFYEARYKYSYTQDNGTQVYYRQAWNYGTMQQGSGWVENRNNWLLVSQDEKHINECSVFGNSKNVTVLELQTASSVGDMIY